MGSKRAVAGDYWNGIMGRLVGLGVAYEFSDWGLVGLELDRPFVGS